MSSRLATNLKNKHLLLTFDAFGTLYKPRTSIPAEYVKIAKTYGIQGIDEQELAVSFRKAFKSTSKQFPNYGKNAKLGLSEWWTHVIRGSFEPVSSKPISDAMIGSLMRHFSGREAYCFFDDVLPFFAYLKDVNGSRAQSPEWPWKSTTVGIITNSDNRVAAILEALGLRSRDKREGESKDTGSDISFVAASYDVGFEKPDARIFHAARDAFAQLPTSAEISDDDVVRVHVGDDLEKDVIGAIGAGWTPIFLDRDTRFEDEKGRDRQERSTLPVTHPVTHEKTKINRIRNLSRLRPGLPPTNV
ncbi:hypothetical protein FKW77_002379 [Venturia effusa]|uniref:Haloacid dehalogenase-like hydrolase domain-containing protein 3 n=1 Tax=Venturia effusa TaxID=50376 RepID=A0A517LIB6_9PEZI|nr:hypothetical protein FKW77_002379 [Venturia effusa]